MKISLDWLGQHVDLAGISTDELSDLLTFAGIEVEAIEEARIDDQIVVAQVLEKDAHPNADKLTVCQVAHGAATSQIVCGAKNFQVGDKVPLALPGSVLPGGMKIKKGKLRGVESHGMMCSATELGIPSDVDGLLILDAAAENGTKLNSIFGTDTRLTIEVTPNRPDWLSHLGLAREVAAITSRTLKSKPTVCASTTTRVADADELKIDAQSACPFYSARVIRGVRVGKSPRWLQGRLEAIGLRPINNVVDVTNFVLMETGQPLHAFDVAKLDGGIHVRPADPGEKLVALDGETYELTARDTVIADAKKALAIGGVMGGEHSGVTEATTDILLESAYFDPARIRGTSHRLALSSDSSYRFERGVDPQQVLGASELAARLIVELAGGEADGEVQVAGQPPTLVEEVDLDHARCRQLLGADIPDDRMINILSSLGLEKTSLNAGISTWRIPSYRLDLHRCVDLIEEVARIYGLDKIPSQGKALTALPRPEDNTYDLTMRLKRRLVSLGFCETPTLSMVSEVQIAGAVAGHHRTAVPIKNPLGTDYKMMRTTLLAGLAFNELSSGLLNVASRNANLGAPSARVFEIGPVYSAEGEETLLSILLAGDANEVSWMSPRPRPLTIHDLRGVIEALLPNVEINVATLEDAHLPLAADLNVRLAGSDTLLGRLGQCAPALSRQIGYDAVLVAELRLQTIEACCRSAVRYREISPYPAITRDVAIEIDATVANQTVRDFFRSYDEELLESYALFDVFADPSGKQLAADKKSLAYSLTYRSKKKTLESKTVDAAHAKVLQALQKNLGVTIR